MSKISKETIDKVLHRYLSGTSTREIAVGELIDAEVVVKVINAFRKNSKLINDYVPGDSRPKVPAKNHFTNEELIYIAAHSLRGIPLEATARVLNRNESQLFGRQSPSAYLHLVDTAMAYRYLLFVGNHRYYEREAEAMEHIIDNVGMREVLHDFSKEELENHVPKRIRALAAYFAHRDKDVIGITGDG